MVSLDHGDSNPVFAPLKGGPSTGELSVVVPSECASAAGNLNVCGNGAEVPLFANGAPLIAGVFGAVAAPRRAGLSGGASSMPGKVEEVRRGEGCVAYRWIIGAI